MPGDAEDRLRRLEELVVEALRRLERLEALLGAMSEEAAIASRLTIVFSMPAVRAIEAARRIVEAYRYASDPISRAVLEALADCSPRSVSEITRLVRELRGTASRRIVRERLQRLVERGVVVPVEQGSRILYRLAYCEDSR
ncbi:hypothetical protein PYJP_00220 [Pyrofollis japonicus]|uniref:hypothetical protein n=1 Tax=Pyrofollis japonicus TaxID=3060460 RepID=UPI00295BCE32|nr:hypothetical protein [Pyrofollis japonicus]BEP16670.1 hypothetical protein PYJP_00220 [Pyrofollis japonicus]